MIDRVIDFSIRNRWAVIVAGLALALWGAYAIYHTPMDAVPDLSENQAIVFTDWPGHSPREIEDQITYPLSVELQGLAGVRVVRSSSEFNFSSISVILEDGADYYFVRQRIAERLARAASLLPTGVAAYLAPDGAATGQIFWYTVEGRGYDLARLRDINDWFVRPRLAVPGVAEVACLGGQIAEYEVAIDPRRLADRGLTPGEVVRAVAEANGAVGGHVVEKANAEYVVRGVGWLGDDGGDSQGDSVYGDDRPRRIVRELEAAVVRTADGGAVRLDDVATVSITPRQRRGVMEVDGNEVTGGVVLMRQGENPLEVTRRLHEKIGQLAEGLPRGVRVVPVYDRTPLIESAVGTVTATVIEAIATATLCVLLVLMHLRSSIVIAVTLPLAALASFVIMWALRKLGVADIQTNIMSLAGIAVSIGVLVDSSIVMVENVMHTLHSHFGDAPVRGDVRPLVSRACRTVGRPIFFSIAIMLVSFVPVFSLGGLQGKMFHPLAYTKSFALLGVAVLAITLVPALATVLIRGRLRDERASWLVRTMIDVYRPVLDFFLSRPAPLVWFLGLALVAGAAPIGSRPLLLGVMLAALAGTALAARTWRGALCCAVTLVLATLAADEHVHRLLWQKTTPLDEGMVMDMPITVPRASVTQAADDLKTRDMVLCRFPEVEMVVGKAGRAETPSDPAPLDMIETMVGFRPRELWPRRKLRSADAERQAQVVLEALVERRLVEPPPADERASVTIEASTAALTRYDGLMREYAYERNREFQAALAPRLVKFAVEQTVGMLARQGRLTRPAELGDLALVAEHALAHAEHHQADDPIANADAANAGDPAAHAPLFSIGHMTPQLVEITKLARFTGNELTRLGLVEADADLFAWRPGLAGWARQAVGEWLGWPDQTFFTRLHESVSHSYRGEWRKHVRLLNNEIRNRGPETYTRVALEELLARAKILDPTLTQYLDDVRRFRARPLQSAHAHHEARRSFTPVVSPRPDIKAMQAELAESFARSTLLWRSETSELADPGGEIDRSLQMPGWANVWTRPIQNRVDMLATGVNTDVGVRVLGRELDDVLRASDEIAAVVKQVPGAADVMAESVRGKGYLEVRVDRRKAALAGVSVGDVNQIIETALAGTVATTTIEGRERHAVRVRYARDWRQDETAIAELLVPAGFAPEKGSGALAASKPGETSTVESSRPLFRSDTGQASAAGDDREFVPLADVADIRVVEGPASIKSENGLLRNYVRLNVRGRGTLDFVSEARRAVADRVRLPEGVYLEWTGQFEHDAQAVRRLWLVSPLVIGLILLMLYRTYGDLADALLILLAAPGAIAGGILFQSLLGYDFSVTVLVGYIACFGMAMSTGIVMLVYLREAVEQAGGLERMTLADLREAVMRGAVHRLRPKLLTEATTLIGLAPMLWATGTGAEVIKPMAAPVLGGILLADEVIDLLLPVLFYWVRRARWQRLHAPT